MNTNTLTSRLLLGLAALAAACSTIPERPGSEKIGSGAFADSRNEALVAEAERALQFGKYAEVERTLSRWTGLMEDPRPLILLGRAALEQRQFGYAAEMFVRAAEFQPQNPDLLYLTAQAQEATGQWILAASGYMRTLELDSSHLQAAVGAVRTQVAANQLDSAFQTALASWNQFGNNAEYAALAADVAFASGNYGLCVAWSQNLPSSDSPEGAEERLILALAWSGDADAALAAANRSSQRTWAPAVYRAIGNAAFETGQTALAIQHLQRYLDLEPSSAAVWHELAQAHFLSGSAEDALAAAEASLTRDPASADCQLLRAHCLTRLGRDELAAIAYCDALGYGADPTVVTPFLDRLVMREGNSLQAVPTSSAKGAQVLPQP